MSTVIKVENLSKQYRLGKVGTGALAHDVNRWWYRLRGKEDPYLKIGETNDRAIAGSSDYVWALRDVNFEVKHGEVLGIIGRNGAGKSTLLKILSRTTAPTTGNVKIKGRVASLLEVGTGFHPELSGRENIFLNGAILGMTKREIQRKFDEIVDFAGVERYIDTPVKRYSSGMYVRLAFAVAAHLEPEILIVDEVLAVGDAEFQKKCLGKMKDVSEKEGRTVLFVSHNMRAVQQLCTKILYLINGTIRLFGGITECIEKYYLDMRSNDRYDFQSNKSIFYSGIAKLKGVRIDEINTEFESIISSKKVINVDFEVLTQILSFNLAITVVNLDGYKIFSETFTDNEINENIISGNYNLSINFNLQFLKFDTYFLSVILLDDLNVLDMVNDIPISMPEPINPYLESKREGVIRYPLIWGDLKKTL
ncbi:MAG TPA: polysaccharide ABC transporter ATP-binding protein [Chitinophagaceae bacterium]|nr:polysaccharide ABC transporter ATP-binding protein [Chitinophagaceae bacterium]